MDAEGAMKNWFLFLVCLMVGARTMFGFSGEFAEWKAIRAMTAWSEARESPTQNFSTPEDRCGIKELSEYEAVRLDHDVDLKVDSKSADREVKALDRRVLRALLRGRWIAIDMGPGRGIPNLRRCYGKDGAITQIYETTGRCTMNSSCRYYDGFSVVFYFPKRKVQ